MPEDTTPTLDSIIARGGELAVARLLLRGLKGAALNSAIGARFPGITPQVRSGLLYIANMAIAGGQELNNQQPDYQINPDNIVTVNPTFQGWRDGARAKFGVTVAFPGKEQTLRLVISTADISDIASLHSEIYSLLETLVDQYEERLEGVGLTKIPKNVRLTIDFAEKAF